MLTYYTRGIMTDIKSLLCNYPFDSNKIILIYNECYSRIKQYSFLLFFFFIWKKLEIESESCTHRLCALSWPIKNDLMRNFWWKVQIEKHFYKTFGSQERKSLPLMFVLRVMMLRNSSFTEEIFTKLQCSSF